MHYEKHKVGLFFIKKNCLEVHIRYNPFSIDVTSAIYLFFIIHIKQKDYCSVILDYKECMKPYLKGSVGMGKALTLVEVYRNR